MCDGQMSQFDHKTLQELGLQRLCQRLVEQQKEQLERVHKGVKGKY